MKYNIKSGIELLQANVYTVMHSKLYFQDPNLKYLHTLFPSRDKIPQDPSRDSSRSPRKISGFALLFFIPLENTWVFYFRIVANRLAARECPWEKWQRETTLLTFFQYNTAGITRKAFTALNF